VNRLEEHLLIRPT